MNQILILFDDPGAAVLFHASQDMNKLTFCTSSGPDEESCVVFLSDAQVEELRQQLQQEGRAVT